MRMPEKDSEKHKLDLYPPQDKKDFRCCSSSTAAVGSTATSRGWASTADWSRFYASQGIGTVVINHCLSPGVKHPEHIKDVARALAWTVKNIEKYGGPAGSDIHQRLLLPMLISLSRCWRRTNNISRRRASATKTSKVSFRSAVSTRCRPRSCRWCSAAMRRSAKWRRRQKTSRKRLYAVPAGIRRQRLEHTATRSFRRSIKL